MCYKFAIQHQVLVPKFQWILTDFKICKEVHTYTLVAQTPSNTTNFNTVLHYTLQVFGAQAISGTGSIRIGMDFLKKCYASPTVYIPNPDWGKEFKSDLSDFAFLRLQAM